MATRASSAERDETGPRRVSAAGARGAGAGGAGDGADGGLTFEQAVERLESLIERIESGEAGLEASIAAYEEGAGLIRRCRAILDRAEQRISEIDAARLGEGGEADADGARSD